MGRPIEIGSKFYYNSGVQVEVIGVGKMRGCPAIVVRGSESENTFTQTHTLAYAQENLNSGFWKRSKTNEKYIRSPNSSEEKIRRVKIPRRFKI
jgi:hypothetical protein